MKRNSKKRNSKAILYYNNNLQRFSNHPPKGVNLMGFVWGLTQKEVQRLNDILLENCKVICLRYSQVPRALVPRPFFRD